jgi:hypothetical protein
LPAIFTILLAILGAAPVRADTLGYLQCTPAAREFTLANPGGAARLVVARTQAEWRDAWRAAYGNAAVADVDFDRHIVVGVINGPKDDRVIYRIQLDDAARARTLEVHLGAGDALCGTMSTRKRTGAHFVVTPRSALPVHFVRDEMVDGGLFGSTNTGEGVESNDLGTIAAGAAKTTGKAALREDAERAAVAALSAADRKQLLVGPLRGPMKRIPHGWTRLDVTLDKGRWTIKYDDLVFEVDAATGRVTRIAHRKSPTVPPRGAER